MAALLRSLRDLFVSLKLTVVLLVLGMILVFVATIDQVNLGIWGIQHKWFRSFVVMQDVRGIMVPIFPGGYLIGGLYFINLFAAHIYRFKFGWRKSGILLTLSGLWQEDFHLRLNPGETKNYSESSRAIELALVNTTDPKFDEVVAIPEGLLSRESSVQDPKLPFRVVVKHYYPNSMVQMRTATSTTPPPEATSGFGAQLAVVPLPMTYKEDERNLPSAFVELIGPDGSLGTWLASLHLVAPQEFTVAGQTWKIALRPKRAYKPFSLTLVKFSHDRYPGTEIPKNFSSKVHISTPDGRDDRDVLIYMNNPLRYQGLTFYQAGFENNDRTTILQVVRNPSWQLPYVACALMTLGLLIQFGIHLTAFVGKRRNLSPAAA
jgi:hypothetical protein